MFAATKFTPRPTSLRKRKQSSPNIKFEPVHVFCRLLPLKDCKSCVTVTTPQEICISGESKGVRTDVSYKFKHVFTAFSTQKDVFECIAYPLLEDLLKGKNGLLFAYGVTGSGKTYTLTGDCENPGIIPQCIHAIFNSINDQQTEPFLIKSDKMNGFELQTEENAQRDRYLERKVLAKTPKSGRKLGLIFNNDGTKISNLNKNKQYAVFISHIEIYNNNVYDLLDDSSVEKPLQSKILREDVNHTMYVNGVVEVEVKSKEEVFDLISVGQKRKKTAHTNLNSVSSRSHSIVNIRIVQLDKAKNDNEASPADSNLTVSQLSIIDLAGSERANRTQNTGTRLKEASCINNSLMTLRSCIEILRENQQNNMNKVVPYRDSRLTYLFKNYFESDSNIHMIVCVDPSNSMIDENLHVMKFAEMTQEVKVARPKPKLTPATTNKTISKRPVTLAKISKTKLFLMNRDLPVFKFDASQVDECGGMIDNLMKALSNSKSRMLELDNKIDKKSNALRRSLVEIENKEILKNIEVSNLEKQIQTEKLKNMNLCAKFIHLEAENVGAQRNNEVEVIESLHEQELKLNKDVLPKKCANEKFLSCDENMDQEVPKTSEQQENVLESAKMQLQKMSMLLDVDYPLRIEHESYPSLLFQTTEVGRLDECSTRSTPALMVDHKQTSASSENVDIMSSN